MSTAIFTKYRHSGKFEIAGPLLALAAAGAVGFPAGYVYAYVVRWIPFIYVNFLATLGYGLLFAYISGRILKHFKVRNYSVAAFTGVLSGIIALYFAWSAHIHASFEEAPYFLFPGEMWDAMKILYQQGTWGMHEGEPVNGIPLATVWLVEAGMIVGMAAGGCYKKVAQTPFCETSQCWLDQVKQIDTLQPFTDAAQLSAFKVGDLGPLTQAKPREEAASNWTRLLLKHSPQCQTFHTLSVQNVRLEFDKKGKASFKVKPLSSDLILPAEMFGLITKFENFTGTIPVESQPGPAV